MLKRIKDYILSRWFFDYDIVGEYYETGKNGHKYKKYFKKYYFMRKKKK